MKKIILALSVLFTTNAMAYQVAVSTVKSISTNPGSAVVQLKNNITNNDHCTHPSSKTTLVLPVVANTKTLYSALLSASVSGKKTRILYNGCLAGLPKIIRVDLLN